MAFAFLACERQTESENQTTSESVAMMSMSAPLSSPNRPMEPTEQKIIKKATLEFQTSDLDKTATQIYNAVKKYKAQIEMDSEGKGYNNLYRNITIRVPNQDFENIVNDISKGVSYFDRKEISSEDVTEKYIDIEARLKAKKELESRYLELLKKAVKVSEMLEIERELSNIREEIESKQGQLNYMQSRISMSTLNIYFYKETVDSVVTTSYSSKMWNAIKSGANGISSFFLSLLYIWPFILLSLLALYYLRRKLKKRRNKNESI